MKQSSWDEQDSHFPPSSHPVFQGIREQEERTFYRPPATRSRSSGDWRRINREGFSRWEGSWGGYRGYPDDDEVDNGENSRIVAQVIGSALLVLLIYVTFNSTHPYAQRAQQVVQNVVLKESDFSAVTAWLQTHLGNGNLTFPVTANGSNAIDSDATGADTSIEDQTFVDPLTDYKVTAEFDAAKHPAMSLQTKAGAEVQTVTKGKVKSVDKNDKYGVYVIVEHSGTVGQTLYGHLASVAVKPGDWLYTGQTVGKVAGNENADLFFAYIKSDSKFSDPREILKRVPRE
jgi:murein DD-endopeptidase MepM/ murein hydrolase activator NlpD